MSCAEFAPTEFYDDFSTIALYLWPNFLTVGIVDIPFQSAGTGKYATPTGYLNFHLQSFLTVKSKDDRISSHSNPIIHSSGKFWMVFIMKSFFTSQKELLNGHYVACLEVAGMCYPTLCMWLYLKLFEALRRMTSSVTKRI